jgi:hypothetical protein
MFLFTIITTAFLALLIIYVLSRTTRKITLITGNARKLADFEAVFAMSLKVCGDDVTEVQSPALQVAIQKARDLFAKIGPCLCEDTSLGLPDGEYDSKQKKAIFPAMIKHLIDACKVGNGNLVEALTAISPQHTLYDYKSTVSICTGTNTIVFQCGMKCKLRCGGGKGDIDPHVVPVCYALTRHENGQTVVLVNDQAVENPDEQTIGEMPERRADVHPRYFALRAAKEWLSTNGYSINN